MVQALPARDDTATHGGEEEHEGIADAAETREAEVLADGHGQRLDRWLVQLAPEFSRNHLQSLVERGCVLIDGVAVTKDSRKLLAGQRVSIELLPTEESRAFRAEVLPFIEFLSEHHRLKSQRS